ncbi:MAG: leucyl/phenylalanyl-tRNA--protein transferase [Paracoccaceae bacterium]|nr:leucyl/phenylalanyl-tRNA--protein transferase [Paracoccaceae bacterium]
MRIKALKGKLKDTFGTAIEATQHRGGQWATAALGDPHNALCYAYERMPFTAERVIQGCSQGLFANETSSGDFRWFSPKKRFVILPESFHVSKRTRGYCKKFEVSVNTDYTATLAACADREETWIGPQIQSVYKDLHQRGVAHSFEARQDGELVGGCIGLGIGGYFTLESLFHRVSQSSKVVMVHLGEVLFAQGYELIDCQEPSFLAQFGAAEIPREEFLSRIARAAIKDCGPPTMLSQAGGGGT